MSLSWFRKKPSLGASFQKEYVTVSNLCPGLARRGWAGSHLLFVPWWVETLQAEAVLAYRGHCRLKFSVICIILPLSLSLCPFFSSLVHYPFSPSFPSPSFLSFIFWQIFLCLTLALNPFVAEDDLQALISSPSSLVLGLQCASLCPLYSMLVMDHWTNW